MQFVYAICSFPKSVRQEYQFDGFRFDGITSMLYHSHGEDPSDVGAALRGILTTGWGPQDGIQLPYMYIYIHTYNYVYIYNSIYI